MARTNGALVQGVVEQDQQLWPDLTPFIDAANLLVDRHCLDSDYEDSQLLMIETWLAAHFYSCVDMRATQEGVGGGGAGSSVSEVLQSKVEVGLRLTHYGQMAMRLDDDGNLAALDNALNKVASFLPAGTRTPKVTYLGRRPDRW